jgi:O-methyltransferase
MIKYTRKQLLLEKGADMINTVIFGSGQMGAMIRKLLGGEYYVTAYADNSPKKQGGYLGGIPILSPEDALKTRPECFCLGVLDDERSGEMERQIRQLGFEGEIIKADALEIFDARVATMRLLAERINKNRVEGDAAELGVFKGQFARHINEAFRERKMYLFDTFEGFDEKDVAVESENGFSRAETGDFSDTCMEEVLSSMPFREQVTAYKGYFPDTFGPCLDKKFCFVSLDPDLYEPVKSGLELFWPRMSPGGAIIVHDYNSMQFFGVKKAVDEFCESNNISVVPVCDLHGSALIIKDGKAL